MSKTLRMNVSKKVYYWFLAVLCCLLFTACEEGTKTETQSVETSVSLKEVPAYSGEPYVEINGNEPDFPEDNSVEQSFETYSELDSLGRCGEAYASVGVDLMPTEERGSISHVKPTGWHSIQYDHVDGKSLYNRCHLIGFQLTGENANERTLITDQGMCFTVFDTLAEDGSIEGIHAVISVNGRDLALDFTGFEAGVVEQVLMNMDLSVYFID